MTVANLQNIYFVLVKPNYLGNIGSVARVMKNFGLTRLRFVGAPREYKDSEARRMAVDAIDVLKNAELFDTLEEALADIAVSVGTTSCQQRDLEPVPMANLASELGRLSEVNKIAIVFGDERNGLTTAELVRCHHIGTVPTDPAFPALNLAQAAGICAYELTREQTIDTDAAILEQARVSKESSEPAALQLATQKDDDILFTHLAALLHDAGFTRSYNHDKVMSELRQFYQRARPTLRETELVRGALRKLSTNIKTTAQSTGKQD